MPLNGIGPTAGAGVLKLWKCIAVVLLLGIAVICGGLVSLALPPRANHVGGDIRSLWAFSVVIAIYSLPGFFFKSRTRRLGIALFLAAVVLAGLVLFLDYWNLLVEHDLWCDRGMPARWAD